MSTKTETVSQNTTTANDLTSGELEYLSMFGKNRNKTPVREDQAKAMAREILELRRILNAYSSGYY